MKEIDHNTVVVYSGAELKNVLEGETEYSYIFLGSDVTLEEGVIVSDKKHNLVIDGTYLDTRYTYTVNNSDSSVVIKVSSIESRVVVKNLNILCCNTYGVVCAPLDKQYQNTVIEYNNITFRGLELGYNPYGTIRIINADVTIENTLEKASEEAAEAANIYLGGDVNITSTSENNALFFYRTDIAKPSFYALPHSNIVLTSEKKEFMQGTTKLFFNILHDACVKLTTGNGFAAYTIHGAQNVFIDERATFTFIEKSHLRIPMWTIYGTFTVNSGAKVSIINTYTKTPSDNYNIHFKGNASKFILNNPKSFVIYTPNANVIYTTNPIEYSLKVSRINMWTNANEYTTAGSIDNIPDYSWYKEGIIEITGNFSSTDTAVTTHNFTEQELNELPDITNFKFQSKKQFSVGTDVLSIQPIDSTSTNISGYSVPSSELVISYKDIQEKITANEIGMFSYLIPNSIEDNTTISITACVPNTYIYTTRRVTTPFSGEICIIAALSTVSFQLTPNSNSPLLLPKTVADIIKIVDSRVTSNEWKLKISIAKEMQSSNGFKLNEAVVFKKSNNDIVVLNKTPIVIFDGSDNGGDYTKLHTVTFEREEGVLLNLENNALEANEEYFADIIWEIEE